MNEKDNKYRDYLPENRYKRENSGISVKPRTLKFMLGIFWVCVIIVAIGIGLHFYGIDVLKVESRDYNMNLLETINLDNVYKSNNEEVIWESNNDNVIIENNVAKVVKKGDAYIIGRIGNEQVSDLKINVLTEEDKLRLESHSIDISTQEDKKVEIIKDNNIQNIDDDEEIIEEPENEIIENYTYTSSDESIVKIDNEGNITPVGDGTVIITVEDDEGNEDHAYVTINENDFSLYNDNYSLNVGENTKIEYKLNEKKYKSSDIVWTSNNPEIADVNNDGEVTAKSIGETTITANIKGEIEKEIKITIKENEILPSAITLSQESVSIMVGESFKVTGSILPTDATNKNITWTSDNENIATVDNEGKIIGKSINNTIIHATASNGIRKDVVVTVKEAIILATNIKINESNLTLNIGETKKLSYTITPSNATNKEVTLTSSNPNIVNIDNNGNVIAISEGTATITATLSNNITSTITVTVKSNQTSNNNSNNTNTSKKITSLEINKTIITLTKGEKNVITATISPTDATNKTLSWTSSNTSVATVNSTGEINAIGVGTATITVKTTDGSNLSKTCTVEVKEKPLTSIKLNEENISLNVGNTKQLSVLNKDTNATLNNQNIKYTSSNSNVAKVSSTGLITATGPGTTIITATLNNITASTTVQVTQPVNSITLNKSSLELLKGMKTTLTAQISPANSSNKTINWSSSNKNIVTVSSTGVVTAISPGTATITAVSNNNKKAQCKITVKNVTISLQPSSAQTIYAAQSITLKANVSPSIAASSGVSWKSSDTSIATVNSSGKVTGIKEGTTYITATSKADTSKSVKVKITVKYDIDIQTRESYKQLSYSKNRTVYTSGCSLVSLRNILKNYLGKSISMKEMRDFARNNGAENKSGGGTHVSVLLKAASKKWGFTYKKVSTIAQLEEEVKKGHMVMASSPKDKNNTSTQIFSIGGHTVAILGMKGNQFIVADPYWISSAKKKRFKENGITLSGQTGLVYAPKSAISKGINLSRSYVIIKK